MRGKSGYISATGGRGAERKVISYKNNGFDRVLPDLKIGRFGHACAKFENGDGEQVSMIVYFEE